VRETAEIDGEITTSKLALVQSGAKFNVACNGNSTSNGVAVPLILNHKNDASGNSSRQVAGGKKRKSAIRGDGRTVGLPFQLFEHVWPVYLSDAGSMPNFNWSARLGPFS